MTKEQKELFKPFMDDVIGWEEWKNKGIEGKLELLYEAMSYLLKGKK